MARRKRRSNSRSSAGSLAAILIALAGIGLLLYLPFRGGKSESKVVGILGIVGLVGCLIWWVVAIDNPPPVLKVVSVLSVATYILGIVIRVSGGRRGAIAVDTSSFSFGRGEALLHEAPARFFGEKRIRAFGGLGFRLGSGVGTGFGLSAPVSITDVVDEGTLVVTNRRIIMAGHKGTVVVRVRKIVDAGSQGQYLMLRPEQGHVLVAAVTDPETALSAIRSAVELSS